MAFFGTLRVRLAKAMPAILTIATMCITWVLMGEYIQGMQSGWSKPFFITYVIHSGYALTLFPWIYLRWARTGKFPLTAGWRFTVFDSDPALPVPMKQLFYLAASLQCLSSFVAMTWYISLPETLVSANNAIYQSASAFVFIISIFVLGESVTLPKILAVCISISGVALVSFAPSSPSSDEVHQSVAGYMWVLVSTMTYSIYEVAYARYSEHRVERLSELCTRPAHPLSSPVAFEGVATEEGATLLVADPPEGAASEDESQAQSVTAHSAVLRAELAAFSLGTVGLWTLLTQWPLFFIFDSTGLEPFVWPSGDKVRLLALSTVLDTIYNVALLFGIQITSALWMAVGTVLVVPGSMIADKILHDATVGPQAGIGILLIVCGFVALQLRLPGAWGQPLSFCRRPAKSAPTPID